MCAKLVSCEIDVLSFPHIQLVFQALRGPRREPACIDGRDGMGWDGMGWMGWDGMDISQTTRNTRAPGGANND